MSLNGTYDPANIFARIMRGEIPAARVFEDEVALAIMDVFPQSYGHTLVIPKDVTARTLLDLPAERVGPLFARVQSIAQAVRAALQPDGVRLAQFSGAPAGQTVFHLHVHIIPVYENRAEKPHAGGAMADPAALRAVADQIAAHLPQPA